jgi:DNA/RNA-binding domain of Phe-tRNA-synthetase-like protein
MSNSGPEFIVSEDWATAYPGACVGFLAMTGVRNPDQDDRMDALLDETAASLRTQFGGLSRADLLARPVLAAYHSYYRRFDKTYHVLLQLESIVIKDRPLRARGTLVAAMFQAELTTGLLTAGHDVARLDGGLTVGVVKQGERYTGMGGREITGSAGDMCIRDQTGIVSSVVYGPDDRTGLLPETTAAVFTTYAPAGVGSDAVRRQLEAIADNVRLVSPEAAIETLAVSQAR